MPSNTGVKAALKASRLERQVRFQEVCMWDDILTRTPINKTSALVINQCRCSDELELNGLLEQQRLIKNNVRELFTRRKSKERAALITQANKDLVRLNTQLKPYTEFHRKLSPKSREQALLMVIEHYLPKEVATFLKREAAQLCGIET